MTKFMKFTICIFVKVVIMMSYIIMMSYSLLFIVAALVYSHHTKYRKGPGSFCLLFSPVSSQFIYVYGQIKTQI